jgi:bifunctional N-acetylglucosamine-1-phosphate-uridyltransferase/glucosamine-1-phosphate-acetyltransferase GlmU-like protein
MAPLLRRELPRLGAANAQGEIYLTDLVARVAAAGVEGIEVPADEGRRRQHAGAAGGDRRAAHVRRVEA